MPRRMWLCNECPTCRPYQFGRHADQGEFCPGEAAEVIVTWIREDRSPAVPITLGPEQTIIGHFVPVYREIPDATPEWALRGEPKPEATDA